MTVYVWQPKGGRDRKRRDCTGYGLGRIHEEIPAWIMQGYGTMAMEAGEQLKEYGCERPTHIFVQAGVGSLAGAVVGYYSNLYADNPPTFVVVEAEAAACLYKRALLQATATSASWTATWKPSWPVLLRRAKHHFLGYLKEPCKSIHRCPGLGSANGMRMLGAPIKGRRACYLRRVRRSSIRRTGSRYDHG